MYYFQYYYRFNLYIYTSHTGVICTTFSTTRDLIYTSVELFQAHTGVICTTFSTTIDLIYTSVELLHSHTVLYVLLRVLL